MKLGVEFAEDPRGSSGTRHSNGRILGNEHNPRMLGPQLVERAEYMLRTEPTVQRVVRIVKGTTTAIDYTLVGGDQSTPFGQMVLDACEAQLGIGQYAGRGMMARPLDVVLDPFHAYWFIGHRVGELTWYADEAPPSKSGGDVGILHWIHDIHDIEPSSIDKWVTQDFRTLDGIVQRPINWSEKAAPIPAEELFVVTWQQTGSNWAGLGAARVMSWWVDTKEKVGVAMVRAIERLGNGIPRVRTDIAALDATKLDHDEPVVVEWVKQLQGAAKQMRAGKLGACVTDNSAVKLETYGATDLDVHRWIAVLEHCDQEIAACMGANFIFLGLNDTGSRAVGEVHGSFFRRQCVEVNDQLCAAFTSGPLRRFVRKNFGAAGVKVMPALDHVGLGVDRVIDGLPIAPQLHQAGLLLPAEGDDDVTTEIKRAFREALGLGGVGGSTHQAANRQALRAIEGIGRREGAAA